MYIKINEEGFVLQYRVIEVLENSMEIDFNSVPQDFYNNYQKYKYSDNKIVFDDSFYKKTQLHNLKQNKLTEISKQCESEIYKGIEIKTLKGLEHFSLTEKDQINISSCYNMSLQGLENILYHSDGSLCRYFSKDEISFLMKKSIEHITYHTTYCNHINNWIKRCDNIEELKTIYYGCELPQDLQNHLNSISL